MTYKALSTDPNDKPLDVFGRMIMEHLYDAALSHLEHLFARHHSAPGLRALQDELSALEERERALVTSAVRICVDQGIHSFLFKLQEQADFENDVQVIVRGQDVVKASDGIHGESFGKRGWYARFSKYGAPTEEGAEA
jgi:hypothetical protein